MIRFCAMRPLLTLIAGIYLITIGCSAFQSNSDCPIDESEGIHPNCTCLCKNSHYSITLNECFRVCPENSEGYWPKCKCDSGGYFDRASFRCITCPEDGTGQYPDCSCNANDAGYDHITNHCKKCTRGSYGKFPNCLCPNGATYERKRELCVHDCVWANNGNGSMEEDFCMMCPGFPSSTLISTGNYPNCTCKIRGSVYDELSNDCIYCPHDSTDGVYPNCICENGATYNQTQKACITCNADQSTGVYPKCVCRDPESTYIMHLNKCYACPSGSTGQYPNCKCENAFFSETINGCIKCPTDASGVYPSCECSDKNLTFSAFINACYLQCPANSSGIQPKCQCDDDYFYDDNDKACKSNIGRMCPANSIGIGPDCLCMSDFLLFDSSSWKCVNRFSETSGIDYYPTTTMSCPDNNGKWPQCGTSIVDSCVLRSCLG